MAPFVRTAQRVARRAVLEFHYTISNRPAEPHQLGTTAVREALHRLQDDDLSGPVFRSENVTDQSCPGFVADPFVHVTEDCLHLFFEAYDPCRTPTAVIGHAMSDDWGSEWEYTGTVLRTDRHLSFPYVFSNGGDVFMIPDIANRPGDPSPVRLYRATEFPHAWEPVVDIIDPRQPLSDAVVIPRDHCWWAITGSGSNDEIRVYFSETLTTSGWTPHPENPVVEGRPRAGRPGGRPLVLNGDLIVPFQDCAGEYGSGLRAYEVTELDTTTYEDQPLFEDPLLSGSGGLGWNSGRMHHLDVRTPGEKLFCVFDGDVGFGRSYLTGSMWAIGAGRAV